MKCTKCEWWKPYNKDKQASICKKCTLKNTSQCNDCPYLGACKLAQNERLIKDAKTKKLWKSCTT